MKYAKTILFFFIAIICIAFIHFSGYLDLRYLQQHSQHLLSMVHAHYGVASLIYILILLGSVFFGLPITMPLCLIAGYLFGFWPSAVYSLIGIMIGSISYFLIMRIVISQNTQSNTNNYMSSNTYAKYLEKFKSSVHTHGVWYLLFLHFIHIVPYVAINTLALLTNISFYVFVISTFIGAIPAVAIYSYTGQQITTLNSISDIWQPNIIFLFILLVGFALLPILFRRRSLPIQ